MSVHYPSGEEVRAGDVLGPGKEWDGQTARVVVVIPTLDAAQGYVASDWAYLKNGVMVEHSNANGVHLVHYSSIDEDFSLLHRASQ